jgi:hypothetical protein
LGTTAQRPHLPSVCDCGHPLSSTIQSNYAAKICKRFNLFQLYTVYYEHQVCPRVDFHLLLLLLLLRARQLMPRQHLSLRLIVQP